MKKIRLKARAKINLTLDVLGKRPDGYHEVEMVMQSIDLYDTLVLEETAGGIEVVTDHPLLPGGETNIAYRAARMLFDSYGLTGGIKIFIEKRIPLAAGLAGGSADAAAVLRGINDIFDLGLSAEELALKGAAIGSDVPFCVKGGTALAGGRGEILSALPDAPEMWTVLGKPPLEVSTAEIYGNFNPAKVTSRPDTQAMIKALQTGDVSGVVRNLANVLETVTLTRYPEVLRLKQVMERLGAPKALMSGSGPSVFAIAGNRTEAEKLAERLKSELPGMFIEVAGTSPAGQEEF